MNGRTGSWWGWLLLIFVVLAVFGGENRVPVLPLIIAAILISKAFQRRSAVSRQAGRRPVGPVGPGGPAGPGGSGAHQHGHHPTGHGTTAVPPGDTPMPTIDVPRYPGDGAGTGPPPSPFGTVAGPPPPPPQVPTYGPAGAPPPPPPPPAPPPGTPVGGAPHTSTDPVVSLGQLHLARCGRDLQTAAQRGTTAEVGRVLDEVADLSRRMQDMLGAADGTPGSGRGEFHAGLRAIDRLVDDARGEDPPGAKLTRLTQACLRMGQTGRHE